MHLCLHFEEYLKFHSPQTFFWVHMPFINSRLLIFRSSLKLILWILWNFLLEAYGILHKFWLGQLSLHGYHFHLKLRISEEFMLFLWSSPVLYQSIDSWFRHLFLFYPYIYQQVQLYGIYVTSFRKYNWHTIIFARFSNTLRCCNCV